MFGEVKGYELKAVTKRMISKETFGEAMGEAVSLTQLKSEIMETIESKGRVYGYYKKKRLSACYLLAVEKLDCSELNRPVIRLTGKNFMEFISKGTVEKEDIQRDGGLQGEIKVYRLIHRYILPECTASESELEGGVLFELKEKMILGEVGAVIWDDKILMPNKVKAGAFGTFSSIGLGIAIGVLFGIVVDSFVLGVCLGILWIALSGTAFVTLKNNKKS